MGDKQFAEIVTRLFMVKGHKPDKEMIQLWHDELNHIPDEKLLKALVKHKNDSEKFPSVRQVKDYTRPDIELLYKQVCDAVIHDQLKEYELPIRQIMGPLVYDFRRTESHATLNRIKKTFITQYKEYLDAEDNKRKHNRITGKLQTRLDGSPQRSVS